MVIIFLSEVDTDDGVGVYHLLCRPVSDREGPQIPSLMCLPALCASVLEMLMRGVKITTTSASIYLMSNVNWLRGGQLLFGVTVNVDNVAMGLGLNLERSIYYLDLEPLAFLHGVRPVLTLWSGACQHVSIAAVDLNTKWELVSGVVTSWPGPIMNGPFPCIISTYMSL